MFKWIKQILYRRRLRKGWIEMELAHEEMEREWKQRKLEAK